jgi:molecular chaperone DnaK (HSP70)
MHRLAIDLGTCNTVAVVARDGTAPRALVFDGSPMLPSATFLDSAGAIHVGRDAERLMVDDPARYEPFPKRRIDDGAVLLADREIPVVDLFAAVLRRVAAEAALAGVPAAGGAVLTCPVRWGSGRRAVLRRAAEVAGFGAVHVIDEPVAAAWYCSSVLGQRIGPGRSLAVFDFGGGTLDVTVVRNGPEGLAVSGTGGLDDLGGADIDAALVTHLARAGGPAWHRLVTPRGPADLRDRQLLWTEVRAAKEMLSRATVAPVRVPGHERSTHLTREELDHVARPLVDHAVEETARVLHRCGVRPGDLDAVLLVGGSSRLPLVASRLHTRLGVGPVVPEQPELPVAYGALAAAAASAPAQSTAPVSAGTWPGTWPGPAAPVTGPPMSPGYGARPAPGPVPPSVVIGPGVTIEGAVHIRGAGAPPLPGEVDDDEDEDDEPVERERSHLVRRSFGWLARTTRTLVLMALPITIVMAVNDPARRWVLDLLDKLAP